jgi:alkanesulfonate monooxygenase SsuD/methylene tetrahydromethanopterin reductase-like flavin-dependent oxidoreductase (luciferase family)
VVAEHADVWNLAGSDVAEAVRKSQILDGHCEELGRDPATLRRSVQLGIDAGQLDRSLAQAVEFIGAGFREVVLAVRPPDPVAKAELVARNILPRLRD